MKKKYVAVMAGVAAAMAIGAPMALAADLPEFPGAPGGESNGSECSFESGSTETSSNVPAFTPPALPAETLPNSGNCESFGNGQHNGEFSGQDRASDSEGAGSGIGSGIGSGFGGGIAGQ